MNNRFCQVVTFILLILLVLSSEASRQITVQIGRTVTIPDNADRVVLQHLALNISVPFNPCVEYVSAVVKPQRYVLEDYLPSATAKAILQQGAVGA